MPTLYSTFRTDIQSIQHGFVRQTIRQALQEVVGGQEIAAILGPKKAEVVNRAQTLLSSRLAPYGFIVKQFTVNEIRAPQGVMDAIGAKNVMQQQALMAQNELQKNMYQAQGDSIKAAGRAMAILAEARAQAEANQLLSQSITQTLVQYEMTKRWDGKMPQVSGSAVPMIQLPNQRNRAAGRMDGRGPGGQFPPGPRLFTASATAGVGVPLRSAPGRAARAVGHDTTVPNGAEPPPPPARYCCAVRYGFSALRARIPHANDAPPPAPPRANRRAERGDDPA